ncbi:MAG: amino acid adenylation domain-containing protein [Scytonematopsis contorta HA4267-MV1]|jgi:amino acid adenylation domain-containing protein|nr:amino acid adenylation domain-containing protein [Scytonematopsis contorta HA4267-MV1]
MTTVKFLSSLNSLGVKVWIEDDQLRYRAPKGVMTSALKQELGERKTQILAFLKEAKTTKQFTSEPLIPVKRDSNLPLSFSQQRMWFLYQLDRNNPFYNESFQFRIIGTLNVVALEQSINEIIRRHEALRTTFPTVQGVPVQTISPTLSIIISIVDLPDLPEASVQHAVTKEVRQPFDLEKGPLLRVTLLRLKSEFHLLILTMHHIITDGWSTGILFKELCALYQAFATGKPSPLPDLTIQYADFTFWQRKWLTLEVTQKQLDYWKQQLAGIPPLLKLPTDYPRPPVQTFRGATKQFQLNPHLTEQLVILSQQSGTTLFMTLLAAFSILLHRFSGQNDICIGSPFANRNRQELEPLIGFFVNTLVLRTQIEGNPSFSEFIQRVRSVVWNAHAYQDVPFEQVVEALQPERCASYNPLFQVMFVLENFSLSTLELPGMTLTPELVDRGTAQFDLSLRIWETQEGLTGSWEYNSDLFDDTTIARWSGHFQTLLQGIVNNPTQKLSDLPLLSIQQSQQLLVEWNNTKTPLPDACLHQMFEAVVERSPSAIAVQMAEEQMTYLQLNTKANQLAHYLKTLGVGPDRRVGICAERSFEMVVSLLGILKAGGAYVPLDPTYPQERLAFMLEDAKVLVLLTQEKLVPRLPKHEAHLICLDTEWEKISGQHKTNLNSEVRLENLAYVIYTSGSTGKPKGAMNTHLGICNRLLWMQQVYQLTSADKVLQKTPFSFDVSVWEFFWTLLTGACLVLAKPGGHQDCNYLVDLIEKKQITTLHFVPSMLQVFLETSHLEKCQSLLRVICSGEALSFDLQEKFFQRMNGELHNLYGPTEAAIDVTFWQCQRDSNLKTVPIGRPIANTQIYLLDSYLQPVPIGVPGELYISGICLARGYLNRPDLTLEKFIPNIYSNEPGSRLYKTGDRGRYLSDGNIEFLGRLDNQLKIRGFRIELGEIEAAIAVHPGVRETVVVAREDVPGNKYLTAYIVPNQKEAIASIDLRSFLKEKLPDYMIPRAFLMLDTLPLTPNGKVDRHALPQPDFNSELQLTFVAPQTQEEKMLASIWADVLKIEQVGVQNNFFELGGHSLLATQVISRIHKTFTVELPLSTIFEAPTITELAKRIQIAIISGQSVQTPPLLPIPRLGDIPLSFAQVRLWFLDQLQLNNAFYNIPIAERISGQLNVAALQSSLNEIIRRHEVLRTNFIIRERQPIQVIASNLNLKLEIMDLLHLPESEREAQMQQLVNIEALRPFDLEREPLLRVTLLRLSDAEHVFMLTAHHIIFDGWSQGVLYKELATLYEGFCHDRFPILPELPIQYADFTIWQRQCLTEEVLAEQLSYWKKQLAGAQFGLDLKKIAGNSASTLTSENTEYSFMISASLSEKLRILSRQEGATLFITLLSAFVTLLHRYTEQNDIVIGTDIASRNRAELEPLIGFFVNLLVLRTDLSGNPSFRELLKRVREMTLGAYAHQDLPFAKLVELLQPDRTSDHAPLFQVLFVLQNAPIAALKLSELTISPLPLKIGKAKFDLVLFMEETEQGIIGFWKYNTELFHPNTIAQFSGHFETLLSNIAKNPEIQINVLEMFSETEKQKQIAEQTKREKASFNKFKTIKPKVVSLPQKQLIKTSFLQPEQYFPLVIEPDSDKIDLGDWAASNREFIETNLLKQGAILFRGFKINSASEFEVVANAIYPNLFGEYGDLPREGVSGKVYGSTPYPQDKAILFHNESSHLHRWPLKIWFFCVQPAQQGGETPILDCRKVYQLLNPKLREKFEQKQLMYVRNYNEGLDVSWQDFFHTTNKAEVENYCHQAGMDFEWLENDGLKTRKIRPAVTKHPKTGELVFFNQIQLHHISCLEPAVRQSLLSVFGEDKLPRNVYYGDGTPIEDSVMAELAAVYQENQISFTWQQTDILMLDNMLTAHGRNPYVGQRKIVVAMGELINSVEH